MPNAKNAAAEHKQASAPDYVQGRKKRTEEEKKEDKTWKKQKGRGRWGNSKEDCTIGHWLLGGQYIMIYACTTFGLFAFFPWGIPPLQSDWSLSSDHGIDYAS